MDNKVELGINNAFANKKWIEPEEWTRVIVEDIGLSNIQFSFDLLFPSLKEANAPFLCNEIKSAIKKYNASISSTFTGLTAYLQNMLVHPNPRVREAAINYYEDAIKITSEIGATTTGGHFLSFTVKDFNNNLRREYLMKSFFETMSYLSNIAYQNGLTSLTWEYMPTPYEPPHTIREAEELYNEINSYTKVPVYFCFDLGHTTAFDIGRQSEDRGIYHVLKKLIPMTSMLHLQQCDEVGDRYWPFIPEYNNIGIIDPKKIIEMINEYSDHKINLYFEFIHGCELSGEKIIEDHKYSADYWKKFI
ncbi:MAG: sugar phosphate isomerase/epimerase family protein [Candidatus Humimicrobiaceae bacterium]